MGKFNMAWFESAFQSGLAFGKRNASSFMTGGGILAGWFGVYLFWKESKKAEAMIRDEEYKRNVGAADESEIKELTKKEKFMIYASYCWPSALVGLLSTGLSLYSHKMDMNEIAKAYMVSQFFQDKSKKQGEMIDKLKAEIPDKKIHDLENDIIEEEYPDEEVMDYLMNTRDEDIGKTLFIDRVTHAKFRADIIEVTDGIANINAILKRRRRKEVKKLMSSPYYASDNVYNINDDNEDELGDQFDNFNDAYSSVGLDVFLDAIGETNNDGIETRLDELLEFRYYGGGDPIKAKNILYYKQYTDPDSGIPAVCFIDYTEFLSPTFELIERNPR